MSQSQYNANLYEKIIDVMARTGDQNFMIKRWIRAEDITINANIDQENFDANYGMLFDLATHISSHIPESEYGSVEMEAFINEFNLITSEIITYTISNSVLWKIDVNDKFYWIAMMTAIRTNSNIIKYLSSKVKHEMLLWEDTYGCNCYIMGCSYTTSLIELIKYYPEFSKEYITRGTIEGISPIDLLAYNGGLPHLLEENALDINVVLNYTNSKSKMTVLHYGLMMQPHITVQYLLASEKVSVNHLMSLDCNGNIPLFISLLYKNEKATIDLIKCSLYTSDIFKHKNNAENELITFFNSTNIFKNIMEYNHQLITSEIFIEKKLHQYISKRNIGDFIKSGLFNDNIIMIAAQISTSSAELIDCTILEKLIIENNIADHILGNSMDLDQIIRLKDAIKKLHGIFSLLFNVMSSEMIIQFIRSDYFDEKHFNEEHNGETLIDKINMRITNDLHPGDVYYNNITKLLIDETINSPKLKLIENNNFIINCINTYPHTLDPLISRGFIKDNIAGIVNQLLIGDQTEILKSLFDKEIIKKEHLENQYELLNTLINKNQTYLTYVIKNDMLNSDLLNMFTINGIVWFNLTYNINQENFSGLIKNPNITTKILNEFSEQDGSILLNVTDGQKLQILIRERCDFDQRLFFKEYCKGSYFTVMINKEQNDAEIITFLMNHKLFTRKLYNKIINNNNKLLTKLFENEIMRTTILSHKFLSRKIFNYSFESQENIIEYMISQKYHINIIKLLINSNLMTEDVFNHINSNGENYLMIAHNNKRNDIINLITTSKYFTIKLITTMTNYGDSMLEIMERDPNIKIVIKCVELMQKTDIVWMEHESSTIMHKLINKNSDINDIIYLIGFTGIDILFAHNKSKNNKTCLHTIVCEYDQNDIIKMIEYLVANKKFESMSILVDDFNQSAFMMLVKRDNNLVQNVFEYLLKNHIIKEDNFTAELVEIIINSCVQLFNLLKDNNIHPEILFEKNDSNKTPLFFKFISKCKQDSQHFHINLLTEKSMLLTNSNGITLLEHILITDISLFEKLVNDNVINEYMLKIVIENICVDSFNSELLKIILSKEYSSLFNESNFVTYLSECIIKQSKNIHILISSKYYSDDLMKKINGDNITKLINSYSGIKYIFDNNLLTNDVVSKNNYEIFKNVKNPFYLAKLAEKIQNELLCDIKFVNDCTILHMLSIYPKLASNFIKTHEDHIKKILLEKNNKNESFMHILAERGYVDDLNDIVEIYDCESKSKILEKILTEQNNEGENVLMICCDKAPEFIVRFFEKESNKNKYLTINNIMKTNNNHMTMFANLIKIQTDDFTSIIEYCLSKLYEHTENEQSVQSLTTHLLKPFKSEYNFDNLLKVNDMMEIAAISNKINLTTLLNNKNIISQYDHFTKCFALACRYKHNNIKSLFETKKVDLCCCYDVMKIEDDGGIENYMANYLQLACRYNTESVMELLNLEIDLTNALHEQNTDNKKRPFNAFTLAILFEPDATRLLIDSKYITESYIKMTNTLLNRNCMFYALFSQLSSLVHMNKSNKFIMYQNDSTEGNIDIKLTSLIVNYNNVSIYHNPLLKNKDIMCASSHNESCGICCQNIQCVMFSPCAHKSCISCAMKFSKCHVCRATITDKLFFK